jgi:hypothetical protein
MIAFNLISILFLPHLVFYIPKEGYPNLTTVILSARLVKTLGIIKKASITLSNYGNINLVILYIGLFGRGVIFTLGFPYSPSCPYHHLRDTISYSLFSIFRRFDRLSSFLRKSIWLIAMAIKVVPYSENGTKTNVIAPAIVDSMFKLLLFVNISKIIRHYNDHKTYSGCYGQY